MLQKNFIYYKKGFILLNQNLSIYLVSILFMLLDLIETISKLYLDKNFATLFGISFFIVNFLAFCYRFVVPLLYVDALHQKPINFKVISDYLQKIARRLILLYLGILILFFVSLLLTAIIFITFHPVGSDIKEQVTNMFNLFSTISTNPIIFLLGLLTVVIYPLFLFIPIFFTLEKQSFFKSVFSSVKFSLKNINFVYLTLIYYLSNNLFFNILFRSFVSNRENISKILLIKFWVIFGNYFILGFTAAFVLYYLDHKNQNKLT